jgi:hypothetical protein
MLYQRLAIATTHIPHIIGGNHRNPTEAVVRTRVRAWNHAPYAPIPMLYQRSTGITHSPHIVGGDHCNAKEPTILWVRVRARNYAPHAAIPMLYQRIELTYVCDARISVANSPNVVSI